LKERLSDPKQELNKSKRTLLYRVSRKVRFLVRARKSQVHVIQRGRFTDDKTFWSEHLSAQKVESRRNANDLGFTLNTREDYKFFQTTMEQKITGFQWTSAEIDDDEGESDEGENEAEEG
jgi:hypothetical protein